MNANPAGLGQIAYRVGDFTTFRRQLLQHLPGETELAIWRPTAGADLGMQVLDWWAYIADVLTFYNERIANEDYLGTAELDASVRHLVSLLGYRPRPGIGASAELAVIASRPAPLVVPAGLAIASKATPGLESQTFETATSTTFAQPTSVPGPRPDDLSGAPPLDGPPPSSPPGTVQPPAHPQLVARGGVLVKGTPGSVAVGDRLLLIAKAWNSASDPAAVVTVTGLSTERDPHRRKNTRVLLSGTSALPSAAVASDYRLARATRTGHLASLPSGATVIADTSVVLDGPARYLKAGDPLLVQTPGADPSTGVGLALARLTAYAEKLWYANANATTPNVPPSSPPGIPLVVAMLTVGTRPATHLSSFQAVREQVAVLAGWTDVGALTDTPVAAVTALPSRLTLAAPPAAAAGVATTALVEDANGLGATITATPSPGSADVTVAPAGPGDAIGTLQTPLRILWDLVTVTRGATVRDETLGTGDATLAGQDFRLSKQPVTFLPDAPGRSGDGYASTVVLTVGDRYWTEVPSLYGHGPDEAVFETWNDDDGATHVRTGTGETGRRLPSGAAVSATYRVGSGVAVPAPGALSQVLTAVPNLRSVRNPVTPTGGADPEPAGDIRRLAPRSVLTFGRAISGDDYAAVAAAAPGVARAAAEWEWDATQQRPLVWVYVGDDAGALNSARTALAAQADPNRPLVVVPAVKCPAWLSLTLRLDPAYVASAVYAQVASVLTGTPHGLFASGVLALGEPLYRSRVEQVVTAVPGVLAVHHLRLIWSRTGGLHVSSGPRFAPGPGGFFTLRTGRLALAQEGSADD